MKNELSLKEIQNGELQVLRLLDRICNKLDLNYFICYGTLLGAVRHHGFIPWDDDIDVVMPREDYEIFLQYCRDNSQIIAPIEIIHYTTEPNYIYPIARLSDSRYKLIFNNTKKYRLGLFVDIYPLDGCGNSCAEATKIRKKKKITKIIVGAGAIDKFAKSSKGWIRTFLKYSVMLAAKIFGELNLIRFLDNSAKRIEYKDCKYVGITSWEVSGTGYFKKEYFDEYELCKFDGYEFRIPKDYDNLLKEIYGNYMELPPKSERVAHHYYKAFKNE